MRARESSNFRRSLRVASPQTFARARVYFARPTITIAKIRDYSQSIQDPPLCHMLKKVAAETMSTLVLARKCTLLYYYNFTFLSMF